MPDLWVNKNGTEENINDVPEIEGLDFLDLKVSAPQLTATYQTNPGIDGELDLGQAVFGPRVVQANFYFNGVDLIDFELACRAIWTYFFQRDLLYIRSGANPGIRYRVRAKPYDSTRLSVSEMSFTLEFDLPSGFGEGLGTTLDMFAYESDLWQLGQNLPTDEDLQYVFNAGRFRVYNASDITLDPVQHHLLQIALTCLGTPIITNHTTGDVFSMTTPVTKSDVLLIDGVYPYLNGQHCGRETNHGIITLAKGWNDIEIASATGIDCSWLTRFLYH